MESVLTCKADPSTLCYVIDVQLLKDVPKLRDKIKADQSLSFFRLIRFYFSLQLANLCKLHIYDRQLGGDPCPTLNILLP